MLENLGLYNTKGEVPDGEQVAEIAVTIQEGAFDFLDAPVWRVAAAEVPLPDAKPLELAALPDAGALAKVIREVLDATRFER